MAGNNDFLVQRFSTLQKAVAKGKENLAAAQREFDMQKKSYEDIMAEIKEKFGCDTREQLAAKIEELTGNIVNELDSLEALLKAAGIPI